MGVHGIPEQLVRRRNIQSIGEEGRQQQGILKLYAKGAVLKKHKNAYRIGKVLANTGCLVT